MKNEELISQLEAEIEQDKKDVIKIRNNVNSLLKKTFEVEKKMTNEVKIPN